MWSQSFLASPHFSSPPKLSLFSSSSSSSYSSHQKIHKRILCLTQNPSSKTEINLSKRHLNLSILTLFFNGFFLLDKTKSIEELQRYTDSNNGFTLLIPSSYTKVEKAGANALFEEPNNGSNNIGVVVSPVRIKSLDQFGTPQFVADKLINAEKRKESTKEAEVVSVGERSGLGQQVYEFEYKIDSTRGGIKRVFSAAFVSSNKLYLLNVVHSDKPENPLDSSTRVLLEQVLHSFDALPLT
ncbi:Mog1/PsbP alpha/beta/alpha sandwich [Arabidopsis thaliana x Arabidopsis arenosa]|uniref:Mog1/PsbP alpha/beta/alpha sandwich n=1 Tax=Arabidopsis thaliana x Arabidopsis arenosa TaxID=1240361 RepID=A0A8T2A8W6_9BRAS|nr:Mog1/PsbP alpha/beta/alpha sandwich [Arabidopsis thaliana x Arabidopsis arenosa]